MLHTSPTMQGADVNLECDLQMSWVMSDALDLPRWMDQNFCQSALRMGWNYDLLPCPKWSQIGQPTSLKWCWFFGVSVQFSPRGVNTEAMGKLKQEESGLKPIFNRLYIHWISRDSILYSVCFKIFPRHQFFGGFPQMFRCRTIILARNSEMHRPRRLGDLHVGLWSRGETPLPLGLDRTYIIL